MIGNHSGVGGKKRSGDLIEGDDTGEAAADQGGKAVAPEDEAKDESGQGQKDNDDPGQGVKVFHDVLQIFRVSLDMRGWKRDADCHTSAALH